MVVLLPHLPLVWIAGARILSVINTANALTFLWDEQPNPETFTGYLITSASINEVIPKQSEETSYQRSISNLTPGQLYEVSLFLQPITTFPDPLDQLQVRTGKTRAFQHCRFSRPSSYAPVCIL